MTKVKCPLTENNPDNKTLLQPNEMKTKNVKYEEEYRRQTFISLIDFQLYAFLINKNKVLEKKN